MSPSNMSVGLLLNEKEQEVARLREQALSSLEAKLHDREEQLVESHNKFLHLQQDYEYNLELLDGRDAELERYDKEFDAIRQELAAREHLVCQLRTALAKAESDAQVEKDRCGEVLANADRKLAQLDGELAQARQSHEQALLRQQEHTSLIERQLQRDLADARGALQKQWRELSASFEDQLRHLELECNTKLEQATEQMKLATQQAAERESEASEAHSKERVAADAAAEASQQARELQKHNKALVAELERVQRVKDTRIAQLQQECSRLQHQARDLEEEHRGHLAEVVADVEAMKKAMTDQRDDLDRAAQRAQRQHEEELSVQKARMATLTGQRSQLQADLSEARTLLKLMSRQASERLERLAAEKEAELTSAQSRLAAADRHHEAELRQSREECWGRQQEVAAVREKLSNLKTTLEDRRKDIVSYKEQLVASGDRERELQRQLTQAGLQAEALLEGSQAAAAAESEDMVKGLIQQRDTANDALLEAQAALLAKDDELAMLRQDMHLLRAQAKQPQASAPGLSSGGLADLRTSLEQGLGLPVSHPTLEILLNEQAELKAALQDAHDQNERLRLTVSAMRSDMESMHQHTTSPGPPTQPHQSRFPSSSPPCTSPYQQPQPESVMQSQLLSQLQHQSYQQLPQQLPLVGVTGICAGDSQWSAAQAAPDANVQPRQQEEEVQSLRQQLQDAKCEAQDLAAENERLMELSNALRSERDRAGLIQNSPAFCPQHQQLVAPANVGNQDSMQQPLVNLTPACMSQSHVHHPVQQGLSGFQHVPRSQTLQAYVVQQPYQTMPLAPHSFMLGQGQGSFDQPQMQSALMQPHESLQYVAQPSTGQSAVPQGQQQPKGPTQTGADDSLPCEVWQRLQRIECLAEQISAAQAGKSPGATAESSPPLNALNHGANRAARRGEEVNGGLLGSAANADAHRPRAQSASDRSTPSQRARLKALQQRQGPRARVRNYNQQDDVTQ
ncbi:TPA: Coiled-coil domain-containing protein 57, variant 2 [Trebouxia sp. C0004]